MEKVISNVWQGGKLIIKACLIGGMTLVLLIPTIFIQNVIKERESRQKEAVQEVSSKWAGEQLVTGPILIIPYEETVVQTDGKSEKYRYEAYFLPDKLDIKSTITPYKRKRGIYEVILYSSDITFTGKFSPLALSALNINPANILWDKITVCMGVSDPKGLQSQLQLKLNDSLLNLSPAILPDNNIQNAFSASSLLTQADIEKDMSFSTTIRLNGSEKLLFTPVGKETTVNVSSTWSDPSFTGNQLPVTHKVTKDGFNAEWRSLFHTRKFPQQWKDGNITEATLNPESFGTKLIIPVNGYQKTMRSVKYAILCILLTFAAFFIMDTVHKKSVHPFQYGLIGLALILFYTLLLSFSEYTGFNIAYIIASVATVGLIGWFVKGILQSSRLTTILSVILVIMYSYLFTILQLQDYSLILGSIGLFFTLAVIMHFSKRIKW